MFSKGKPGEIRGRAFCKTLQPAQNVISFPTPGVERYPAQQEEKRREEA